jgi:hypothetical protein
MKENSGFTDNSLAFHLQQKLVSLQTQPIAIACAPDFYQRLNEKHSGGIESIEALGVEIYQCDNLSMAGELPHKALFRLFFNRQELYLFLNNQNQSTGKSPPHFSRSTINQPTSGYSQDIARETDNFLSSMNTQLSGLLNS